MVTAAPTPEPSALPMWRLVLTAVCFIGIQLSYAAQTNLGTPHLLYLGIGPRLVSLAWLAGPLSGLIMQPLIGYLSDNCVSRYGRRRPFLLVGSVCTALSLILFAYAPGVPVAVFAFFCLDFSIQAVQAPLRSLLIESVPSVQRAPANAYLAACTGVGNLLGGLLASTNFTRFISIFPSNVHAVFLITAVLAILFLVPTLIFAYDPPLQSRPSPTNLHPSDDDDESTNDVEHLLPQTQSPSTPVSKLDALLRVPEPFWAVFSVQLCTWCGFFTVFVYVTTWIGQDVFNGNPSAASTSPARDAFDRGVRLAGSANALSAVVTLVYALVLPRIVHRCGVLPPYVFSQVVEMLSLTSPIFLSNRSDTPTDPPLLLRAAVIVDVASFGIVWATTMVLPWTIIGDALSSHHYYRQRIGFFSTVFNASQSFPQLVVAVVAPVILRLCRDDPAGVLFVGGVIAGFGAFLAVVLRVNSLESNA